MKIITLIILLFIFIHLMHAQSDKDLFHVNYNASPLSNLGEQGVLHSIDADLKFPVFLGKDYLIAGGLGYESIWTDGLPALNGNQIHGLSSKIAFSKKLENNRVIMGFFSAGLYSDLEDISGEDLRFTAGIIMRKTFHDDFDFWFGLAYSKQFFGSMLAPFIDLDWQISDKLKLTGPLPINTRLAYHFNTKAALFLFLKPENSTYRLSEEFASRYFQKKQWNIGLGFDYHLSKHWVATLRGGHSLRRAFEVYDENAKGIFSILTFDVSGNEKRTPIYSFNENNWLLELNLAFNLNRK